MNVISKSSSFVILLLASALANTGCNETSKLLPVHGSPSMDSSTASRQSIANPATQKCVQDGHTPEAILSMEGVPIGYVCINQKNNKKCEEWAYFRGECQLKETRDFSRVSPSSPQKK